jgi:hypothetical protein
VKNEEPNPYGLIPPEWPQMNLAGRLVYLVILAVMLAALFAVAHWAWVHWVIPAGKS